MKLYLVICRCYGRILPNIANVGVIRAKSPEDAKQAAASEWQFRWLQGAGYVGGDFDVFPLDELKHGWLFYRRK